MIKESLQIYNLLEETETLGPFKRFAIWLQGCNKNCEGCLSPRSKSMTGGKKYKIPELTSLISENKNIEGLTISGGEPFLQAKNLNILINNLKKINDYGIILYTGYTLEELKIKNNEDINNLLKNIDLLIDGEYNSKLDDGKSLRGSSNQKIIPLSCRYENYLDLYGVNGRKIEMFFKKDKIHFSGVPGKKFLKEWNSKFIN